VIISDEKTIKICNDKWLTYKFFKEIGIPTPETSLEQKFKLVKPRHGRGSKNIVISKKPIKMKKMISQQLLKGKEVTIDIFCDVSNYPVYIIPRERTLVIEGKSVDGKVIKNNMITKYVKIICKKLKFVGPINIQCFILRNKSIKFLEINPRIGGGMALGFAASENWIPLIQKNLINKNKIVPKKIQYGLHMKRFYAEKFVPKN
jgi:carbamoyl-phosphate synthase large subunit